MVFLQVIGDVLVALVVVALFLAADLTAKNNLPAVLRDELERVITDYGNAGNSPVRANRDRDLRAVHPRGAERVTQSP